MKFSKIVAFVACIALLSSCDYQKYNHIGQQDVRANNEVVYGVSPDSLPRQMSYKYDAQPELETRANDIRARLYSKSGSARAYVKQ